MKIDFSAPGRECFSDQGCDFCSSRLVLLNAVVVFSLSQWMFLLPSPHTFHPVSVLTHIFLPLKRVTIKEDEQTRVIVVARFMRSGRNLNDNCVHTGHHGCLVNSISNVEWRALQSFDRTQHNQSTQIQLSLEIHMWELTTRSGRKMWLQGLSVGFESNVHSHFSVADGKITHEDTQHLEWVFYKT